MTRAALIQQIFQKGSFLCVGLDPDLKRLPGHLRTKNHGVLEFCKAIVDATRPYAVAYKPNTAFFEALGARGWEYLLELSAYIGKDHFTIADAKRADIGNTSQMYAKAFFQTLGYDAVTIAPYMGSDSVQPFLEYPGKWAIVLALTSNEGASDYQLKSICDQGHKLYHEVITTVSQAGSAHNLMFVVGATRPEMLAEVRSIAPRHFLLVPGVGAQGGSLHEACRYGITKEVGLLVNASRSIIYASEGLDFAEAAALKAAEIQSEMKTILQANLLL